MKIAVATIAKNESQFVQRWAESCVDADYRFILDTGSTDDTVIKAADVGVYCEVKEFTPWRFDHARNYALSQIPEWVDYVIWLDMDEMLQPGWREALETVTTTRPRYKYVWSWNTDGSEGLVYAGDKIHIRNGYVWKHPVHEVLKPVGIEETQQFVDGLEIHHHPDSSKSRGQYFDLLKLAVNEDSEDDRNQFYLAREYYFHGQLEQASVHFKKHLELSVWAPEKAASCRYLSKCEPERASYWLYRAVAEDASRRESWVDLACFYYAQRNWEMSFFACSTALSFTVKPLDYLCEADAWGWLPHDLMAIACWNLGKKDLANYHGSLAVSLNPRDSRLKSNLGFYVL